MALAQTTCAILAMLAENPFLAPTFSVGFQIASVIYGAVSGIVQRVHLNVCLVAALGMTVDANIEILLED